MPTRSNQHAPHLLLASASPRRAELLRQLQLDFQQRAVDVDERIYAGEAIADYALRMAREKATLAWQHHDYPAQTVVLGADTCGEIDGELLAKPVDFADAKRMLTRLSDNTHTIYSAFALFDGKQMQVENIASEVTFYPITEQAIARYWQTGEPHDKAGAYAIQGIGAQLVKHLSGSYSAVMGLALAELAQALPQYGIQVL